MKRKVKLGLAAVLLSFPLMMLGLDHARTPYLDASKQTQMSRMKATWKEKNENKRLAKEYAWAAFGWRGREWQCLLSLWTRESRFDHLAQVQLSASLKELERRVDDLHSKYCQAYVTLIDVTERLAKLSASIINTDTIDSEEEKE